MQTYLDLLSKIRRHGTDRPDRTGVGTRSLFGEHLRFDLGSGFPVLTTKYVPLKAVIYELLWFLRGDTNIGYLHENHVKIWDDWADQAGDLGPIYGRQWRSWPTCDGPIDQIAEVVRALRETPESRRIVVSAWNVGELSQMALAPCHCFFQFYVAGGRLSCHLYQRSADVFLGVPFNIASYALLTMMLARVVGLEPGDLVISYGDVHLYRNHFDQADLQLERTPFPLPRLFIADRGQGIDDFVREDFTLINYEYHPAIKAPIAV